MAYCAYCGSHVAQVSFVPCASCGNPTNGAPPRGGGRRRARTRSRSSSGLPRRARRRRDHRHPGRDRHSESPHRDAALEAEAHHGGHAHGGHGARGVRDRSRARGVSARRRPSTALRPHLQPTYVEDPAGDRRMGARRCATSPLPERGYVDRQRRQRTRRSSPSSLEQYTPGTTEQLRLRHRVRERRVRAVSRRHSARRRSIGVLHELRQRASARSAGLRELRHRRFRTFRRRRRCRTTWCTRSSPRSAAACRSASWRSSIRRR